MPSSNERILESIDNKIAALRKEIKKLETKRNRFNEQGKNFDELLEKQNQIYLNETGYKTGVDSFGKKVRRLGTQRVIVSPNSNEVDLGGGQKKKTHKKRRMSRKKTYRKRR